jgi:hypothetical protein
VYWITERYAVKLRRQEGLARPWSADRIFQTVRFCNVHREDDAVTQWIRQNWSDYHSPAWWFVLGRTLNYVPTLEDIVFYGVDSVDGARGEDSLPTLDGLRDGLKAKREAGEKIFTSAYTISTCGKKMDKIDYVLEVVEAVKAADAMTLTRFPRTTSLQSAWEDLQGIDGLGSFLAAQVVADMKNTRNHPLAMAPDYWTFSAPGPGSLRGLSWYFYPEDMKNERQCVTAGGYAVALRECRAEVDPLVAAYVPRISDQDFQNCLCEFSKYCKVKYLSGHVRNKFQGA